MPAAKVTQYLAAHPALSLIHIWGNVDGMDLFSGFLQGTAMATAAGTHIQNLSVEVMKQRGVRSVSQTNLFNEPVSYTHLQISIPEAVSIIGIFST